MGRERTEMIPRGRNFETVKMVLRLLYAVFIWYEFIFKSMNDATYAKMGIASETAFYIGSGVMLLFELVEMTCADARLLTTLPFFLPFIIYFTVVATCWSNRTIKIVANSIFDILILYNTSLWLRFGQEDMGNFKLHGKYGVGFKKWKAAAGNDCLIFYPVDKNRKQEPISPYNNIDKVI